MMLCYRRLIDDDPYSVILRVPRVESRLFPGPASLFARILRNWATKYISPGDPSIAHNGFGGTNPWGESIESLHKIVTRTSARSNFSVIPAHVSGAREESRIPLGTRGRTGILRAAATRENDRARDRARPELSL
jgi:hypothetical protein